jgi:hypothetical protein
VWVLVIPAWFFIESFLKAKGWLYLDEDMRVSMAERKCIAVAEQRCSG